MIYLLTYLYDDVADIGTHIKAAFSNEAAALRECQKEAMAYADCICLGTRERDKIAYHEDGNYVVMPMEVRDV